MSFLTCFWLFPQKEHFSRSPPSPMRATSRSFQSVCPERRCSPGHVVSPSAGHCRSCWPRRCRVCHPSGSADPLGVPARAPCPVPVPRRYRQPSVHPLIERRCRRGVTGVPPRADKTPRTPPGHGPTPRTGGRKGPWPGGQDSSEALRLASTSSTRPYSMACAAVRILSRSMSLLDLLDRAAGVLGQRLLQPGAHPQDLVGLDLDVAGLAVVTAGHGRLVDQDAGVRQGEPLALVRPRRAARRRPRPPGRGTKVWMSGRTYCIVS